MLTAEPDKSNKTMARSYPEGIFPSAMPAAQAGKATECMRNMNIYVRNDFQDY